MKKNVLLLLIVAAIPLGLVVFGHYRDKAVVHAAYEFAPRTSKLPAVPAGTRIKAVLKTAFTESSEPGERVLAFTTEAVKVQGQTALMAGTQLEGFVDKLTSTKQEAHAVVRFLSVEAEPVMITAPVHTDVELMGSALDTVAEAGVGTAFGAASGNERSAIAGMALGALNGASALDGNNVEITVVLTKTLPARTIRDDARPTEPANGKGNESTPDGADSSGPS